MKSLLTFLLFIQAGSFIYAQTLPSERIELCTTQSHYNLNDTITYYGKIERVDSIGPFFSNYVYVELYDCLDSLISRQKLAVKEDGTFKNRIPLESYYQQGNYNLRAYTRFMQNFPIETFPIQELTIGKKETQKESSEINISFYPEGGHLVAEELQNLSLNLQDEWGNPLTLDYSIKTNEGDTIAKGKTSEKGWDIVHFIPKQSQSYTLYTEIKGRHFSQKLPDLKKEPSLRCTINKNKLYYFILGDSKNKQIGLYHEKAGLLKWKAKSSTGNVFLDQFPKDGVIHIFLMDNRETILAECSILQDSHTNTTQSLTSQLFSDQPCTTTENNKDLQAWVYSTSIKAINIKKVLHEGFEYKIKPEKTLSIKGKVKYKDQPWALKNGNVVIYRTSDAQVYEGQLNEDGEFEIPVDDYFTTDTFFIEAFDKHGKAAQYDYEFINDTIPSFICLKNQLKRQKLHKSSNTKNTNEIVFSFDETQILPEIVVKSRIIKEVKPEPKSILEKSRFIGPEEIEKRGLVSIDQFLDQFRAFCMVRDYIDPKTHERDMVLLPLRVSTLQEKNSIPIILDGNRTTLTEVYNMLNPHDIESMELMTPTRALFYVSGALNGALYIKTRKGKPQHKFSKGIKYIPALGLTPQQD